MIDWERIELEGILVSTFISGKFLPKDGILMV